MEEKLRKFLFRYLSQEGEKKDWVLEEDIDMLVGSAILDGIEQEIIDYGTEYPEASFWDFHKMLKPGLYGVTQEELLDEDDEQ